MVAAKVKFAVLVENKQQDLPFAKQRDFFGSQMTCLLQCVAFFEGEALPGGICLIGTSCLHFVLKQQVLLWTCSVLSLAGYFRIS